MKYSQQKIQQQFKCYFCKLQHNWFWSCSEKTSSVHLIQVSTVEPQILDTFKCSQIEGAVVYQPQRFFVVDLGGKSRKREGENV